MKLSQIIEVRPVKNMWGKYTGNYEAFFVDAPDVKITSKTKEETISKLVNLIKIQFENLYKRKYVFAKNGNVFCLYYVGGWNYDILHPDGRYSTCVMSEANESEAFKKMQEHVKQYNEVT